MPGKDPISQFGDLTALQVNLDAMVDMVNVYKETIKSVPEITTTYKNSGGGAELKKNTEDLIAINKMLDAAMKQISDTEKELQSLRESGGAKAKKLSDDQLRASVQARAETKARTDAIKAEGDAYKQLSLEYNKAAAEAKKLQAVALKTGLKEDAEAANLAVASAKALNTALKGMDQAVGDSRRNVGNYKEALQQAERELYGIRMAMVKLAGMGDSAGGEMETMKMHAAALVGEIERLKTESRSAGVAIGEGGLLGSVKEFGKQLMMQAAMFVGIYQAFSFLKGGVEKFEHAEEELSKLNNILKNIGREDVMGHLTAKVKSLTDQFKTVSKTDVVGVFDQLIVYGKLTEHQINELMPVIVNFSAQTGKSMEESTSIILKGLEGSARGLKEFGINMKDGKDAAERFSLVMTELAPRVEGAAKAFGETTVGQVKATEIEISKLQKQIGEQLEPAYAGFLKFVADGLSGIPQIFEAVGNYFGKTLTTFVDQSKTFYYTMKGLVTHDFSDLAFYDLQKKKIDDNVKSAKEWAQINAYGKTIAEEAAKGGLGELNRILKDNEAMRDASARSYAQLQKEGKQNSEEGHAAFLQLARDQAVVAKLYDAISQMKDKRVLGVGGGEDAKKDFTDYEEGFRQLREEFEKFHMEAFGIDVAPFNKELNELLAKYQDGYVKINDTRDKDLEKVKENEEKKIISSQEAGKLRVKIENDTENARLAAETAYYANLNAMQEKHRAEVEAKQKEQAAKDFKDAVESQQRIAKALGDDADAHFREQVTVAKNNDKAKPTFGNDKALAAAERDQQLHNLSSLLQQKKITQAEYDSDAAAAQDDYNKKVTAAQNKQLQNYAEKSKAVFNNVAAIEKQAEERRIAALQHQIQLNDQLKDKEIGRIRESSLSESQKAAATDAIQKRTADQNAALQRKEREEKQKEAAFEKAKGLMDAVVNTYVNASRVSWDPIQEGLVIAAGLAAVAQISAQRIPAYAGGTEHSKAGWSLTDERGPEGYITPSGKTFLGNDRPTLRFLEAGTQIIPHEKLRNYQSMQLLPRVQQDRQLERKLDKLNGTMERMEEISREQVSAFRKQKTVYLPSSQDPGPEFWAKIYKACS